MNPSQKLELHVGEERLDLSLSSDFKLYPAIVFPDDHTVAQAAIQALASPIEYPALKDCIVDGDRIAIAVTPYVPHANVIVPAIVKQLLDMNIPAEFIHVVLPEELSASRELYASSLAAVGLPVDQLSVHQASNQEQLAYLGADEEAEPVYVNRVLYDADMVLPIVRAWNSNNFAYSGLGGIVPWFLGAACQKNWRRTATHTTDEACIQRLEYSHQIRDWLGVAMVLCVGSREFDSQSSTIEVIAGNVDALEVVVNNSSQPFPDRLHELDTLVACVQGGSEYKDWDYLARLANDLCQLLPDHGTLVICTDLKENPSGALRMLSQAEDIEKTESKLLKSELPHTLAALALWEPKQRVHIYLHSQCRRESVEDIGIGHVSHAKELETLIGKSPRVAIIQDAQWYGLGRLNVTSIRTDSPAS